MDEIIKRLEQLVLLIKNQNINKKEVLNFRETCLYLELSHSHLYKLTSGGKIPHYKPNGKKIYFNRKELDVWLLRNRVNSIVEVEQQASDYLIKNGQVQL